MDDLEQIQRIIQSLEAQRAVLGDAVLETALAPLQEKLAALQQEGKRAQRPPAEQRKLEEQRKLVTLLFADLVDFTALSEMLDPEDVREILSDYFNLWTQVIEAHGGLVEKYIGDAVMAVYGLPAAHEADPESAIRTALEMRKALESFNAQLERARGLRLAMRVGINTGAALVSTLDERKGQDFVVVGDTVNLASRLQSIAPAGGILIAHDTYRHVRGAFDVQPLEPVQVKGRSRPVQVYLVQQAKPRAYRMTTRGVEGVETRMVGRERELEGLQRAFREVLEERALRVVTLVGEAGIGKSRMLYEFENWLELRPETWYNFRGRAHPTFHSLAYSLLRDMFAHRFQIQDSDAPQAVREKLEQEVAKALGETETSQMKAHFIGHLLGFKLGDSPHLDRAVDDAGQFHERALAYLGEYFRTLASEYPLVALLEDIHWADDSSLDLLGRLSGSLASHPVLIVCTARRSLLERRRQWGEGLAFHTQFTLQPLGEQETGQLVQEILQKVEALPARLREMVVANAEGNPFYVEELIRMLIEDGVIVKGEEHWRVEEAKLADVRLPPTLLGLLQARLDSLAAEERMVLQRAAVIGRIFWDQAVRYISLKRAGRDRPAGDENQLAQPAAGMSSLDREIFTGLEKLRAREMVERRREPAFAGTDEYVFKHALMRDVTYQSLLKRQRRIYHADAARWLEQTILNSQRADEFAALIAGHYEQAGEHARAAGWHLRAGEYAAARFANAEAVYSLSRALDFTPKDDRRDDRRERYTILLARERVYNRLGARQEQVKDLETLSRLAKELGDERCRVEVLLRQASLAFLTGEYAQAMEAAEQVIHSAHAAGDPRGEIEGLLVWGKSHAWLSDHAAASSQFERALGLARAARLPDVEAEILWNLSIVASNQAEYAKATSLLHQALALTRQSGDRPGEGVVLAQLGVVFLSQGDYSRARPYMEEALDLFRAMGYRYREAIALGNLGVIAYEKGDYGEAKRLHLEATRINYETNDRFGIASSFSNLGDIARDEGQYMEARSMYEKGLALSREMGDQHLEGLFIGNLSLLYVSLGDYPAAIDLGRQAWKLAQELEVPRFEAYAASRLAEALLSGGRLDEAEGMYRQAIDLQRKLNLENNAAESLAGLARIAWLRSDFSQAQTLVLELLQHLEQKNLDGTDDPARVYLTCYQVLEAAQDGRAIQVLEAGYRIIQKRASKMDSAASRQSFLENVPSNRELVALWEAHSAG